MRMLLMSVIMLMVHHTQANSESISGTCNLEIMYGQNKDPAAADFSLDTVGQELEITLAGNSLRFNLIDIGDEESVTVVGITSDLQAQAPDDRGVYTALLNRRSGLLTVGFTRDGELSQETFAGFIGQCYRSLM